MESFAVSRTGHGKQKNEDYFAFHESQDGRVLFFIIADGMGGYVCGDFASKITTELFVKRASEFVYENSTKLSDFLKETVVLADEKIKSEVSIDASKKTMGSTVVCAAIVPEDNIVVFCNVGDSKGYLFENNVICFVTHDHSVSQLMIDKGYTEEETKKYLSENPVTKAVGYLDNDETGDCTTVQISNGDIILLCSDGFYKGLEQTEIGWLLKENSQKTCESMCNTLMYDALGRESTDDITIIVVKI